MELRRALAILSGEDRSAKADLVRGATRLAEPIYRAAVARRNRAFDTGKRQPADLGKPTISVGNLTTGGTGKTPMVLDLAKRLLDRGERPAILLRGYKGKPDAEQSGRLVSDEAEVYRATLPESVRVEPDPDRAAAAKRVLADDPGVTCFLLDDGFQHRQVRRDLDLVLIDATCPFGFDHLIPRGLLREPAENLERADAVIVTHADRVDEAQQSALNECINELHGKPPIAHTAHTWTAIREGDRERPVEDLASMRVVGVCGLGNPEPFRDQLESACRSLLGFHAYDDHHDYARTDLSKLVVSNADALVMTEKDWVKCAPLLKRSPIDVPVLRPVLALGYREGEDRVGELLAEVIERAG